MVKCVAAFDASIKKYLRRSVLNKYPIHPDNDLSIESIEKILAKLGHDHRDIESLGIVDQGQYEGDIKRRWDI